MRIRIFVLIFCLLGCQQTPTASVLQTQTQTKQTNHFNVQLPLDRPSPGFRLQTIEAPEPQASILASVSTYPVNPDLQLRFEFKYLL